MAKIQIRPKSKFGQIPNSAKLKIRPNSKFGQKFGLQNLALFRGHIRFRVWSRRLLRGLCIRLEFHRRNAGHIIRRRRPTRFGLDPFQIRFHVGVFVNCEFNPFADDGDRRILKTRENFFIEF
jgi:hypothetical protein